MIQCINRFLANIKSNVGEKLWKVISNLGISLTGSDKDYAKTIKELENGTQENSKGKKAILKRLK